MKTKFFIMLGVFAVAFTLSGCDNAEKSKDSKPSPIVTVQASTTAAPSDAATQTVSASPVAENTPKPELFKYISEEDFQKEVDKGIERYIAKQQEEQGKAQEQAQKEAEALAKNVPPLRSTDHLYGNKDAKVIIFEYSDFQCPYCKKFHPEIKKFIDTHKADVALVFRDFPLVNIHPYALKLAEAGECVSKLGGEAAYWKYADKVFSSDVANDAQISDIAVLSGVQKEAFDTCVKDGSGKAKVQKDLEEGAKSGVTGTPGNIFYNTATKAVKLAAGALPTAALEQVLAEVKK